MSQPHDQSAQPHPEAPASTPADLLHLSPDEREAHWYRHQYVGAGVRQLSFRAVAVGSVLGSLMSIAALYTTLKIGWSFGVAITACVLSYVSWNALRALSGNRLSQMTMLENNCMQSTASAAGYSTGSTISTAVAATLLITGEHFHWTVLVPFVLLSGLLGVFLAIPMKRQMINIEQLRFPSGIAAAETLRSLYSGGRESLQRAYALVIALALGAVVGVLKSPQGVPGIPADFVFVDITAISITTGNAQDFVAVRVYTDVSPEITINTAGGNSDVIVEYAVPSSLSLVASNVTVTGGTASDKVAFLVDSQAASFAANWTVNHGNGANETIATINSTEPTDALAINLNTNAGTGTDKADLFIISNAAMLDVAFGGNLGSNTDSASFVIDGLGAASTNTAFNMNMGTGNDAFNAEILSRGGSTNTSGTVAGSDGLDTLVFKLEGDGNLNTQFDGGNGNDLVDFSLKGSLAGRPRLLGGAGNDELKLTLDGPLTLEPFFDGGTGFDIAIGFGTFVNVEQIN